MWDVARKNVREELGLKYMVLMEWGAKTYLANNSAIPLPIRSKFRLEYQASFDGKVVCTIRARRKVP